MIEKKFVIFSLGNQSYCVDIDNVREIILYKDSIEVPNAPSFVEGVINLRGDVVNVINLSERLNKRANVDIDKQKIILGQKADLLIGFLVDDVTGMITVTEKDIIPAPNLIKSSHTDYISGVINKGEEMSIIIDTQSILNDEEVYQIRDMEISK